MSNTNRFFVYASETSLYETGLSAASPVEYSPDTRKITTLPKIDGTQQWVVYSSFDWAIAARKLNVRLIEIPDHVFQEMLPDGGIIKTDYARHLFTDNMQDNFENIMINIGYGKISNKLL